jgi:hypothetical protein
MWVNRNPTDPYEPIFVTEDETFHARTTRQYIVSSASPAASRYDRERIGRVPASALPDEYAFGPDLEGPANGLDDSVVLVVRGKRSRPIADIDGIPDVSAEADASKRKNEAAFDLDEDVVDANYIEAVRAAAAYNASLNSNRKDMHAWYIEDAQAYKESLERKKLQLDDEDSSSSA